jgi:Na+/melibiose symporter-like transporter
MGAAGDLKERFVTGYGVGSFATGLYSTVPSVLLLFYCTEILRIAPAAAGLVILIPKLWSLLWDPLVGGWLDRSRRHMAAMKAGAFGLIAAFTALFSTPVLSEEMVVVWVACSYFLLTTLYSLFAVPYTAYPALITSCREDRVRLISRRMMFVMLGVFCGASAAPFIIEATGGGRFGYSSMATILAAICVLAMTTALASIRSGPPFRETYPVEADLPSERPVALLIQNRKFLWLSISFILQLSAVGGLMAMIPYIVTIDFARSEGAVGTSLAIMIGVTIISVPIWARIARQLGDRGALRLASFLYAVSSVLIAPRLRIFVRRPASAALHGCSAHYQRHLKKQRRLLEWRLDIAGEVRPGGGRSPRGCSIERLREERAPYQRLFRFSGTNSPMHTGNFSDTQDGRSTI